MKNNEPVLEMIDPEKGFVTGNVIVVSYAASKLLARVTPAERKIIMDRTVAGMGCGKA